MNLLYRSYLFKPVRIEPVVFAVRVEVQLHSK